ncbi:unnamed protein product [Orchesella dallaii]|uniref:Uncharacterized protein n=1 Tax=Orchesella dallaii TaxID=48710 RepID=A0ABP1RKW8_9HEXA
MASSTGAKVPVSNQTTPIIDSANASIVARSINIYDRISTPSTTKPILYISPKSHKLKRSMKTDHSQQEILMLQNINDQQKQEIRTLRHKLKEEEMLREKERTKSQETITNLLEKLEAEMVVAQKLSSQKKRAKTKLECLMKEYESD